MEHKIYIFERLQIPSESSVILRQSKSLNIFQLGLPNALAWPALAKLASSGFPPWYIVKQIKTQILRKKNPSKD